MAMFSAVRVVIDPVGGRNIEIWQAMVDYVAGNAGRPGE